MLLKDAPGKRLDRIRRKLDTLGSYDIEECADLDFGIERHRFRIEPPLPEEEVMVFDDWLVETGGVNWKERRYNAESWDPFQGTMAICDQGCTYYTVLVLNGAQRGAIWNIELHLSLPQKAPYSGFLDYYEDWVDRMLAREEQYWYGYARITTSME